MKANAVDLYKACQQVVDVVVLQGDPAEDTEAVLRAIDHIVDGIRAGRSNQIHDFEAAQRRISAAMCSRPLRLVTEDEFDELVREGS